MSRWVSGFFFFFLMSKIWQISTQKISKINDICTTKTKKKNPKLSQFLWSIFLMGLFPLSSQNVHQVPNLFPQMFPICSFFYPIKFGHGSTPTQINCKSCIYSGVESIFRRFCWGGVPPYSQNIGDGRIKWLLVKKKKTNNLAHPLTN